MKSVARIKRPYIYVLAVYIISLLILNYAAFDVEIDGLRWIAISLSTIVGILIGLMSATVATIVRTSMSQKQFYQGILANESQWLERWFATHPTIFAHLKDEAKEVIYAIYRHSTTPKLSDEELIENIGDKLLPLPGEWGKKAMASPYEFKLEQHEIDNFETHLVGIGATLSQIMPSKDRMELGKSLSDVLWPLGFVLLFSLTMILCCSIPNIATFMNDNTSLFALALMLIASILVFSLILIVNLYMRTEVKEIKRVVKFDKSPK